VLTFTSVLPRSLIDWIATEANASKISKRTTSLALSASRMRALVIAFDGWDCSDASGSLTTP
jgi:hypothetical protein